MKKEYSKPVAEFVELTNERIITTSGCGDFDEECPGADGEGFGGCTSGSMHEGT